MRAARLRRSKNSSPHRITGGRGRNGSRAQAAPGTRPRDRENSRQRCRGHGCDCFFGASNGQGSESTATASGRTELVRSCCRRCLRSGCRGRHHRAAMDRGIGCGRGRGIAATLEQEMERASAARDLAPAAAVEVPAPAVEAAEPVIAEPVSVTEAVGRRGTGPGFHGCRDQSVESQAVQEIAQAAAQEPEPTVAKEESAYAAAAAAGSASEPVPQVEAISSTTVAPEISENVPVASVEVAPQREAELAAAWQNWKQIRESFVSTPASAPVAEAPAAETSAPQSVSQEDASAAASVAEPAAEPDRKMPTWKRPPLRHRESPPQSPASSIPCWPS